MISKEKWYMNAFIIVVSLDSTFLWSCRRRPVKWTGVRNIKIIIAQQERSQDLKTGSMKEKPMYVCKLYWYFPFTYIWSFKRYWRIQSQEIYVVHVLFSITVSSAVIATVDLVLLVASVRDVESIVVEVVESPWSKLVLLQEGSEGTSLHLDSGLKNLMGHQPPKKCPKSINQSP